MNITPKFYCLHMLKLPLSRSYSNLSQKTRLLKLLSIGTNKGLLINRTSSAIARPKELDDLKSKWHKKRKEGTFDGEDEIGLYGFFLLTIPVTAFFLGTWQIYRRQQKIDLIKHMHDRMTQEPIDFPDNLNDIQNLEYCPVRVRGEFLHDREFLVGPRGLIKDGKSTSDNQSKLISVGNDDSKGHNVITPFKLENREDIILVNRGWVPRHYKNSSILKQSRTEGVQEFTGIVRLNEPRPQFVMKNVPEKNVWNYRDIYQMAELAGTEPIFIDMIEKEVVPGQPIGSQTRVNLRNEHMSYIVTWYGIFLTTGLYWFRIYILKKPIF